MSAKICPKYKAAALTVTWNKERLKIDDIICDGDDCKWYWKCDSQKHSQREISAALALLELRDKRKPNPNIKAPKYQTVTEGFKPKENEDETK